MTTALGEGVLTKDSFFAASSIMIPQTNTAGVLRHRRFWIGTAKGRLALFAFFALLLGALDGGTEDVTEGGA